MVVKCLGLDDGSLVEIHVRILTTICLRFVTSQYWCVDSDATTVYVGKHPLYVTGVLDFKVTVLTDAEDVTIMLANEERLYKTYVA